MDLPSSEKVLERVRQLWGVGAEYRFTSATLRMLESDPDAHSIPIAFFVNLARSTGLTDTSVVLRVLQFLSGAEAPIFTVKFEYFGEGDSTPVVLDDAEFEAASARGVNPESGDIDPDIKSKIAPIYIVSDATRDWLARSR